MRDEYAGGQNGDVAFETAHPALQEFLNAPGFSWETLPGERTRLHFLPGGYTALVAPDFQDGAEAVLDELLDVLGEERVARGTHIFVVDAPGDMQALAGRTDPAWWSGEAHAVFLIFDQGSRPLLRRSLAPLVTSELWGDADPWLTAGFGLWFDGECMGVPDALETLPALLEAAGRRVDARTLVERWEQVEQADPLAAELSAAGLVHFLVQRYGMDGLRALWQEGSGAILRVAGQDLDALDAAWRDALPPAPAGMPDLAAFEAQGGCR